MFHCFPLLPIFGLTIWLAGYSKVEPLCLFACSGHGAVGFVNTPCNVLYPRVMKGIAF